MTTVQVGQPTLWDRTAATASRRSLLIVGFMLLILALMLLRAGPTHYSRAHWYFDYDHGLVSRSLAGTVFQRLGGDPAVHLDGWAMVIYFTTATTLVWAASRHAARRPLALMVAAVVLFAQVIPHLASQLGRLDGLVILAAVGAVAAVESGRAKGLLAASLLLCLAVIVHEIAVVVLAPWVAAYIIHRQVVGGRQMRHAWLVASAVATPAVLLTAAIVFHTPAIAPEVMIDQVFPSNFPRMWAGIATMVHYRGLIENVAYVARVASDPVWFAYLMLIAVAPLAMVVAVAKAALRRAHVGWVDLEFTDRLLFAASMSPLAIVPIAHDWNRWSMFSGMLIGATTVLVLSRRQAKEGGTDLWRHAVAAVVLGWCLVYLPG